MGVGSQLLVAFTGLTLPTDVAQAIPERGYAGVSLFRADNVSDAAQVRALTAEIQAAAGVDTAPLLIATDQETGQLIGLGSDTTPFAGAMALGAVGDDDLAQRVARAVARECLAQGVNVNYWPVCDLATNPQNPGLGIRCFGDDPGSVAGLAAAVVSGLQAEGVAATVKHFPGAGEVAADTHHELGVVEDPADTLAERELLPFRAAIDAGALVAMAGHFAVPAFTGDPSLPASIASDVISGLLRTDLGFDGVTITDALDMAALAQGDDGILDAIAALRAGQDLLLATPRSDVDRLFSGLSHANVRGLISAEERAAAAVRLARVRAWLAGFEQPSLEVVGSAEHRALAAELAQRSITLVRNDARLLPLRPGAGDRIAVIQPRPTDLTPADTSSYVAPLLAGAIRSRHAATDEFLVDIDPGAAEIAAVCSRLNDYDVVILGTVSANILDAQAELARSVLAAARATVWAALRTPWDLVTQPDAATYVCSYGIQPPTIEALAGALFGEHRFTGRLPVTIAGLHERGHGLEA